MERESDANADKRGCRRDWDLDAGKRKDAGNGVVGFLKVDVVALIM